MSEDEKLLKEAKKMAWEDRLAHKNWKVRNDANIDIAAVCDGIMDPKDPRLREFGPLFKKAVADSNAPCQEKALDALIAYLRAADTDASRYAKEVCDSIVAKCMTGRPKTLEKSQAVFLLWVELEASDAFLDAMEKAVKAKLAKAVVPAIDAMYQAVSQFGTKVVPPKRIMKMLPELFDHPDANVRACAKGLTIELCRWIGKDAVKNLLFDKMRDTMKKELEIEVDNVVSGAKPTRKIRSEQALECEETAVAAVTTAGPKDDAAASGSSEIDEYDLVDPVDILTPLGKSTFWDGVKATKWSERRDAVAELTKLASVKKIANGDFSEVSRILKKLVTDVNIAVAVEAVQAIGNLATGLRKDFTSGSKLLLPVLLDKLKEKKQVMVDALTTTLNAMYKGGCILLQDVIEDVKLAAKNKVPLVRSSCLTWVATCIETSSKAIVLKLHKEYVPILMEGLNDSSPEVRDAAFLALAAVAKVVGMKVLERPLEKLDEVRKKKLIELCGVENSAPSAAAPVFSRAQADANGSSQANGGVKASSAASLLSGKRPLSSIPKKSGTASGASTSKSGAAKKLDGSSASAKPQSEVPEDVEPGEMSLEDIETRLGALFEPEVFANLKSANWKERLEAITSLKDTVEGMKTLDQYAELLIRLLCVLPGWNEKNIQVQQKAIEAVILIAQNATRFSKKCVVLCLTGVVEKVGDIKTRIQASKCLTTFCEAVGPKFVFERLFKIMKDHKNPKVLSEGLSWMITALDDFGIGHVPLKDLINFCKETGLGSSAVAVRTATIKLFGVMHKFVGPDLKGFLSDVKPQLQTSIDAEIEKNPYEGPASAPKRAIRAVDVGAPSGGTDGLPREDISAKLTPALLKNMSSPDWKLRQESLEILNGIIEEAHKRIQPTGTGELFMSLKARLNDSNKNLVMMTLATLGSIATAMGAVVEKHSKGILADALKCLGDNKKVVREAVVKMLDSWVLLLQLDKMLPYVIPALVEAKISAEGRKDLFEWVARNIAKQGDQPVLLQLVKPISMGLQDKFVDMRKSAEACLVELIRVFDVELVMKASKGIQGSALAALQTVFDHQRSSSASEDSFTSASTTPKAGSKTSASESRASSRNPSTIGRGAAPRQSGPKQTKTSATLAAEAYDMQMQGQPLFNLKDSHKAERERLNFRKYKFDDAARREQPHDVEADVVKFFREDLQKKLLSPDFKKQIDGLELLQRAISNQTKEIIEILDVIFRWSSLRFAESNTTCLLKVIDFLFDLVEGLKGEAYVFSEFEASILFPCLVEKSGHNIEKVREKIRELTRLLCSIYPAPKVFIFMTDGLKSKNNRTRIECVENIEFMIEQCGIEIVGSTKALSSIAALTVERDGDIRKASLAALATAYKILGEDIWRYVGKITGAQKGVMDEKFKWTAREMDKRKEGKPGGARAEEARALEARADEGRASVKRSAVDTSSGSSNGHIEVGIEGPHGNMRQSSPLDWNEALDIINNATSSEQVVDGLKLVCHELAKAAGDPDSGALDELANDADLLVTTLFVKVTTTFNLGLAGASSRSCKYVLNTLMQTFQVKKLARAVKEGTLHNLITELLVWLLDERVLLMDDGSQLLKAMNVLMLKILENADRTSAFIVLIYLLRPMGSAKFAGRQQGLPVIRNQKFLDLVVKCLIKLTKVLGSTLLEVDLDRILQSIHEYFEELGMAEIRKRAGADDKPLRMVKTLLHELVKLRGTAIKGHLSLVPIDLEPQPIILAYIDLNLQTLGTVGQTQWSASNNGGSSPSNHSAETQLKQELAAVFKKIGDKQTCTIGLYELYRITQLYPQVDIFSQLQNASEAFRTYISDGIAQMERNAAAGRTFGSIPIATPPPVSSPTISHTKSMTSFQHRGRIQGVGVEGGSSHALHAFEDNNSSAYSEARSTEYTESSPLKSSAGHNVMATGHGFADMKTHNQAMGGTLDAIRERMKSIQAGATGTAVSHTSTFSSNGSMSHSRSSSSGDVGEDKALSGLQARMERLKAGGGLEFEITQR